MTTIAFTLLFASSGLFALVSIAATLHRYGSAALRLRQALGTCSGEREVRFALTDLRTSFTQEAKVLRPVFGAGPRARGRLAPAPLRAAA